ncbi:MAG: alpha/beta hydrolase [Spirochaetia bacterium]|nr:alpha/beta hydrolase [Spirochaetia bacterium]
MTLAVRTAILLLTGCLSLVSCRSHPGVLYRPAGTTIETYKTDPVPLRLNIYPYSGKARGAVLFVHGGGWAVGGSDVPLYGDWEAVLSDANLRAFSMEHRLPPDYRGKDMIQDCIDAVRYLNNNAGRFGFPRGNVAIVGFSSGGHIAVMTAITLSRSSFGRPDPQVRAVVSYYAPLDPSSLYASGSPEIRQILEAYLPAYPGDSGVSSERSAVLRREYFTRALIDISPTANLHPGIPHMFLAHGEGDSLVPVQQSRAFVSRADVTAPGKVILETIPGMEHNFNLARGRWAREIEKRAVRFIVQAMKTDY